MPKGTRAVSVFLVNDREPAEDEQRRSEAMDVTRFRACVDSDEARLAVATDVLEARRAGIRATPTLLINSRLYNGVVDAEHLREAINSEMRTLAQDDRPSNPAFRRGSVHSAPAPLKRLVSREAEFVQFAYAKLAYYAGQDVSRRKEEQSDRRERAGAPMTHESSKRFLREAPMLRPHQIETGPIEDVLQVRFADLVTPPIGKILRTFSMHGGRGGDGSHLSAGFGLYWEDGQYVQGEDWGGVTLEEALRASRSDPSEYATYARYTVDVSADGTSLSYRALALFGPAKSGTGMKARFLDEVVGQGGGVREVFEEERSPTVARHWRGQTAAARGDRKTSRTEANADDVSAEVSGSACPSTVTPMLCRGTFCCHELSGLCCWTPEGIEP